MHNNQIADSFIKTDELSVLIVYVYDDVVLSFQQITHIDSSTFNVKLEQVLRMSIAKVYLAPCHIPAAEAFKGRNFV